MANLRPASGQLASGATDSPTAAMRDIGVVLVTDSLQPATPSEACFNLASLRRRFKRFREDQPASAGRGSPSDFLAASIQVLSTSPSLG